MRRVLITGIRGFTGQYIADLLVKNQYEVHGLTSSRDVNESRDVDYHVHYASLDNEASISELLRVIDPSYVIHLAAISSVTHLNKSEIYSTNVIGTENLLRAIRESLPNVSKVILASSANVYGNVESKKVSEEAQFAPLSHYANSKVAMELMCRNVYAKDVPIVIVRPFNYTGVGQSQKFLIPKIISHFRHKKTVLELGNLDVSRDFSDVRDVAKIYMSLIEADGIEGEVFNICSGVSYSLQEILNMAAEIKGYRPEIKVNPAYIRDNELKVLLGDTSRLNDLLRYSSEKRISMFETIEWMLTS